MYQKSSAALNSRRILLVVGELIMISSEWLKEQDLAL
jgi:hypothetical protein